MEQIWDTDELVSVAMAVIEGTKQAEADTLKVRPAPTTPQVGLRAETPFQQDKKASWIEKRLKGKRVTLKWKFAGSQNVHEGVCQGVVGHSKGKSVMLTLGEKTTVRQKVEGFKNVSHRGVTHVEPVYSNQTERVVCDVPLYVPLRAVLSIEALP